MLTRLLDALRSGSMRLGASLSSVLSDTRLGDPGALTASFPPEDFAPLAAEPKEANAPDPRPKAEEEPLETGEVTPLGVLLPIVPLRPDEKLPKRWADGVVWPSLSWRSLCDEVLFVLSPHISAC